MVQSPSTGLDVSWCITIATLVSGFRFRLHLGCDFSELGDHFEGWQERNARSGHAKAITLHEYRPLQNFCLISPLHRATRDSKIAVNTATSPCSWICRFLEKKYFSVHFSRVQQNMILKFLLQQHLKMRDRNVQHLKRGRCVWFLSMLTAVSGLDI